MKPLGESSEKKEDTLLIMPKNAFDAGGTI